MMIKDDQFRDNPPNPAPRAAPHDQLVPLYTADRPEMAELVAALRAVLDEFADRVLIGEIYLPIERLVAYYGADGRGAQLPFNFQLLTMPGWSAATLAGIITRYEAALPPGAWPNWVLGNHDRPRIASRVGAAQARVAAVLLLTLRGTPTLYMGDELGMLDTPIPPDEVQDPAELRQPGRGQGRDPERTPFPWQTGPGAGFTTGKPWLRVGADTPLSVQRDDPASMVSLHRALLALRARYPALSVGAVDAVAAEGAVLSYRRRAEGAALMVLANTSSASAQAPVGAGAILLSTHGDRVGETAQRPFELRPDEAVVVLLQE